MSNPNTCDDHEEAELRAAVSAMMKESSESKESSSSSCDMDDDHKMVMQIFAGMQDKDMKASILGKLLSACQPQEGSPANTWTRSELQALQVGLSAMLEKSDLKEKESSTKESKFDICSWPTSTPIVQNDWYGAPNFNLQPVHITRGFRQQVRQGRFKGPTNAQCPGFLQCNLVVLPQGQDAYDFLLFCQRNPKACPLIEVCDTGSAEPIGVAPGADLRTDVPMYSIYRNGEWEKDVEDVTDLWPENSVAFLIGCSFSYDGALMSAGIPLRSVEQKKNVPMYTTNLKCRPSGSLHGNMVVSMKPIPALQVTKHTEITSRYQHAHGGPVSTGDAKIIGVKDIDKPEWGDSIEILPNDVPVFHACGVTPQNVLMESKVPFAITHKAGHMFVTDLPSDMGC